MENKKQITIKNKALFVIPLFILLAIALSINVNAAYTSASITRADTGAVQNVYYYTSGNGYKDNVGSTPDVNLTVCASTSGELTTKKVAAFYLVGANDSSLVDYEILGGDSIARFISLGTPYSSGGGYCAQANFEFFAGRSPYPGAIFAVVDTDNDNTGETFEYGTDVIIPITSSSGYLRGSYSFANVQSTYNQATGMVGVNPTGATAYTSSSTTTSPSQTSETKLLLGVCTDSQGYNCTGTAKTSLAAGSVSLNTSIIYPADNTIYNLYAVANGLSSSFCVGPDLYASSVARSPTSGYPSAIVNITATVFNGGNVDVTQDFNITFYAAGSAVNTTTITGGLADQTSTQRSFLWDTTGQSSGSKSIYIALDDTGIGDCSNSNDNSSTTTFTVLTAYFAFVWIDGTLSTTFPDAGRPYNITINLNNSDGFNVANATIKIYEENGYSIFAPQQLYNATGVGQAGVRTVSVAEATTDTAGMAYFTIIPTGNKLYEPEYSYLNAFSHVGNYSIYLEAFNSTADSEFPLVSGGSQVDYITLNLSNNTMRTPNSTELYSLDVFNGNNVKTILTFAYQAFANARKWLTP